ncbi:hypothetical protein ES703_27014 [subsurface metagenome]
MFISIILNMDHIILLLEGIMLHLQDFILKVLQHNITIILMQSLILGTLAIISEIIQNAVVAFWQHIISKIS